MTLMTTFATIAAPFFLGNPSANAQSHAQWGNYCTGDHHQQAAVMAGKGAESRARTAAM